MLRATDELERALSLAQKWPQSTDGTIRTSLDDEIQHVGAYIKRSILDIMNASTPMNAVAALARHKYILAYPEMAPTRTEIIKSIAASGKESCSGFKKTIAPSEYFFGIVIDKYCNYWGAPGLTGLQPPDFLVSSVVIRGQISGIAGNVTREIEATFLERLRKTPWYSAESKKSAVLNLNGINSIGLSESIKNQRRPWVEKVPFQSTEDYQDPYQVPYNDVEFYFEQVPYSSTELVTVPCAYTTFNGGCMSGTDSRTVTKYRQEMKTRMVTRYKTLYRTLTREVTRYRDESRIYEFPAVEVTSSFSSLIKGTLLLPSGISLQLQVQNRIAEVGIRHNTSFAPANVQPEQPTFTSEQAWTMKQITALGNEVEHNLTTSWRSKYCKKDEVKREKIARCAALNFAADLPRNTKFFQNKFGLPYNELAPLLSDLPFEKNLNMSLAH